MAITYFKPDTLIDTCCEQCGNRHKETLARLYSEDTLVCAGCGSEHTSDRRQFRQAVDETEALVNKLPAWTGTLLSWLHMPLR